MARTDVWGGLLRNLAPGPAASNLAACRPLAKGTVSLGCGERDRSRRGRPALHYRTISSSRSHRGSRKTPRNSGKDSGGSESFEQIRGDKD